MTDPEEWILAALAVPEDDLLRMLESVNTAAAELDALLSGPWPPPAEPAPHGRCERDRCSRPLPPPAGRGRRRRFCSRRCRNRANYLAHHSRAAR